MFSRPTWQPGPLLLPCTSGPGTWQGVRREPSPDIPGIISVIRREEPSSAERKGLPCATDKTVLQLNAASSEGWELWSQELFGIGGNAGTCPQVHVWQVVALAKRKINTALICLRQLEHLWCISHRESQWTVGPVLGGGVKWEPAPVLCARSCPEPLSEHGVRLQFETGEKRLSWKIPAIHCHPWSLQGVSSPARRVEGPAGVPEERGKTNPPAVPGLGRARPAGAGDTERGHGGAQGRTRSATCWLPTPWLPAPLATGPAALGATAGGAGGLVCTCAPRYSSELWLVGITW